MSDSPKPAPPRRPIYGWVRVGRSRLHLKIGWKEYEEERAQKGKSPTVFTMHGFNKSYRVSRERVEFDMRYFEDAPSLPKLEKN